MRFPLGLKKEKTQSCVAVYVHCLDPAAQNNTCTKMEEKRNKRMKQTIKLIEPTAHSTASYEGINSDKQDS